MAKNLNEVEAQPANPGNKVLQGVRRVMRLMLSAFLLFLIIVVARGINWSGVMRGISATKTGVEREALKPGKAGRPSFEPSPHKVEEAKAKPKGIAENKVEESKTKPNSNTESGTITELFFKLFAKLRQGFGENTSFGAELRNAQSEAAINRNTGGLSLKSDTRAKVYLDGQFSGFTPQTVRLAPGEHKVSVLADGHEEWSRKIRLKAGQQINLKASLKKTALP
ncbi:MAG: PEGA domain-containing protein [Acidobacteria bacterium]|nr:PEGA domain-containing protein [Acidobacteriota bacterium]